MTPVFTRAQGLDLAPQRPVGVAHRLHSRVMAPARPLAGGRRSVSARGRGGRRTASPRKVEARPDVGPGSRARSAVPPAVLGRLKQPSEKKEDSGRMRLRSNTVLLECR